MLRSALILAALSVVSIVSANSPAPSGRRELAFAASFAPSLRAQPLVSSFMGERPVVGEVVEQTKEGVSGIEMSCRRNLKKEKRHRNEVMARQFRKPTLGRFRGGRGRGGGRAASSAQDEADSEWLDQIYGQHTIYRRDQNMAVGKTVAQREGSEEREPVAA